MTKLRVDLIIRSFALVALLCQYSPTLAREAQLDEHGLASDRSRQLETAKMSRRWAKHKGQAYKCVRLEFRLTERGKIEIPTNWPAVKIYNSSGNAELDKYAISCLQKSAPFKLSEQDKKVFAERHYRCLATFDPANENASITVAPDIDMRGYVRSMQDKIRAEIFSPDSSLPPLIVSSAFSIDSTGAAKDVRISGTKPVRQPISQFEIPLEEEKLKAVETAAVTAIKKASPFGMLPADSPDEVKMNFAFLVGELRFKSLGEQFKEQKRLNRWRAIKKVAPAPPAYMLEYLKAATDRIKGAWKIPAGSEGTAEKISFVIEHDGTVKDIFLDVVTGNNQADRAALEAIQSAAPFAPLPVEAGKSYRATVNLAP
jgi:TonB family protein